MKTSRTVAKFVAGGFVLIVLFPARRRVRPREKLKVSEMSACEGLRKK
jgi:hypothetical protein